MPAPSINTLSRRFALLKAQEQSLLAFWETAEPFHSMEDLHDTLIAHSETEAEYIGDWVQLLFELLAFMSAGDPEHVKRLEKARRRFFLWMAYFEGSNRKPLVVEWLSVLSWCLADDLPDEMLEVGDWDEGRWTYPLREASWMKEVT